MGQIRVKQNLPTNDFNRYNTITGSQMHQYKKDQPIMVYASAVNMRSINNPTPTFLP